MADNKFIKHLRGEDTTKSVLEIKNQRTTTSFANMPDGDTSNANDVYSDNRGNATGVLKGTENWKLDGQNLVETTTVYGDGRDFIDSFNVFSNGLWVDATCTFATARRFSPNTKFILKLCGHDLETVINHTVDFTLIVKFGASNLISKTFTVTEQAFDFCKEFVIDFAESNSETIKVDAGSTMQIQLLCADPAAQAVLYNGMTVFTALQRRVDGDAVASDKKTFDEVVQDIGDINDEIDQIHEDIDDLEDYVDDTFVRLDGESIMTGPLKMRATSSFQCAIAPFWDGVGFYKLNSDNSVTLIASIETPDGFVPWETNTYNIGSSLKKWKNLYLGGKVYVATINAGSDITVPNSTGEMLVNSATNSTSISIYGTPASGINTINIGRYTKATGVNSIMVGNYATAGEGSMAFGNGAEAAKYGFAYLGKATANYAYQIGRGTNSESYTLYVGWGTNENYKMLDGTTGFIPDARLSSNIARMSDVDLAANSGRMITDQGVWYAKMYAATVAPAAEDGTNYADFSQVDGQGNPVIVTYNRVNGAWVQDQTITPPAEYDGYVPITSKIWDIAEQAGQQGGRILWNHQSKEFTPYPQIISFEDIEVTGDSTVIMPNNPGANQIANKNYVDNAIANSGTGRNIGDIFFTSRTDSGLNGAVECNGGTYDTTDFTGAQSIGNLLTDGKVPYVSLSQYATLLATNGSCGVFGWDGVGTTTFRVPSLTDIFIETGTAAQIGDYLAPSIPNLKGLFGPVANSSNVQPTGIFYKTGTTERHGSSGNDLNYEQFAADASRASGVYDDSATTVQPNAVRYRAMVQLAISATDEAVETCTAITAQVAANTSAIAGADYVVESQLPTAQNNYTWYRKYKSGWVEQGGIFDVQGTGWKTAPTITLPVEMANDKYFVGFTGGYTDYVDHSTVIVTRTTTTLALSRYVSNSSEACWEVKGLAA